MSEEQKLLCAATNMCRAVFYNSIYFPTNCRKQKKANHLFKGELVLAGKCHFEYNRYMFQEDGIISSEIVGGFEALPDHLTVTKILATPHHKDTKD
eukprot:5764257-Ditylum_brightwellii.AAC.1